MPVLRKLTGAEDVTDPDEIPGPLVAFGVTAPGVDIEIGAHSHRKAQLLFIMRGVLVCELEGGLWIVPPHSGLWVPPSLVHTLKVAGSIEGYFSFFDPAVVGALPRSACAMLVTPLLRELLVRAAQLDPIYPEKDQPHLVALILDEMVNAKLGQLHLPMPDDPRLRKIADEMMKRPARWDTMSSWAQRAGLSERTMARLFVRETGLSFGRWQQQLAVMLAIQWLAAGATIQEVAFDLGYENAGNFIAMFKRLTGTSPGRHMAERQSR